MVVPNTKLTKNRHLNDLIIYTTYLVHLVLISLHHSSHWRTFLSDPGYFKTYYGAEKVQQAGEGLLEGPERYHVFEKEAWVERSKERKGLDREGGGEGLWSGFDDEEKGRLLGG